MKFNIRRVLILLVLASIAFWDYQLISGWLDFRSQYQSYDSQSDKYKDIINELARYDSTMTPDEMVEKLRSVRDNMYQHLRVRDSNSMVLSFISKAAGMIGLKDVWPSLEGTKVVARFGDNVWERSRLKIRVRARYHEAARLINILEQSPYLVHVRLYDINRGKKDPTGPTFTQVIADIYRLR